jgi:succinate dehydrogenase flavin-adding protein (antitoxin of CptAB toxin-antitoxin module)
MKRHLILLLFVALAAIVGCNGKTKKNKDASTKEQAEVEILEETADKDKEEKNWVFYDESKKALLAYYELPHIKEFYKWQNMEFAPPEKVEMPEDLSKLTYEELRLLRNEVYARNGYLFTDGYLRGYFNKYKWYMPIFEVDTFKVALNNQEKELIDALLQEEANRKKEKTVEKNGLNLYNADLIANTKQFEEVPDEILNDFKMQNFSIVDANRSMPFFVYDKNAYQYIPHYITTDLYLFILHKYFSRYIEKLDENYLSVKLKELLTSTAAKLTEIKNSNHQNAVEWAQMYNAIALYALGDSLVTCPVKYVSLFNEEKLKIKNLEGNPSFIPNSFVDYGELKPRAHYTKTNKLKKYFRAFKWISLNGIDLGNDEQLKGLLTLAYMIKSDHIILQKYKDYVATIEKLAGQEDNLSFADIVNSIDGNSLEEVLAEKSIAKIRSKLENRNKEKIKKVFGESFQTDERDKKRVYFLSSTYSISGDIFSKLVHVDRDKSKRPFPRALDVPAVFGNKTAERIIVNEYRDNEKWPEYSPKLERLQEQFSNFSNWNHNYGYKGVQTALSASAEKHFYPDFMKTDAYNRKELSTTLSSWTHIKHDLVLYQEKPFAAEAGQGGGPEPPMHYSYVEPNIDFWESALELVEWLEDLSSKENSFSYQLKRIKELGVLLRDVADKELKGEQITNEEYNKLHYVGGTVEYIFLALLETDHLPQREKSMALIADVYVYNGTNLNVAVGHADDIHVIVPIKGEYYIARGSVFSYYEFKGQIYNDEEWRKKVSERNLPDRPEWIKPLIRETKPLNGQMQFRYVGY